MDSASYIDKWLSNTPPMEPSSIVETVLIHYFGQDSIQKSGGGSHHYRVKHPLLRDLPGFGIGGHLQIPVKSGRYVKGYYLKRIAQAVKRLEEVDSEGKDK